MRRFDWLRDVFKSTVGLVAGSLTILLFVKEFLELTIGNTLRIAILIALGGLYLGISAMESDIGDNIDELQTEVNQGFDMVAAVIEQQTEGEDVRTDGAGKPVRESVLPDIGPSGNGALGGMLAGGALGLPFGAAGAVIGGVLGGLVGNEIEYRNLKDQEREKLRQTAYRYLRHVANVRSHDVELIDVTGPRNNNNNNWRFLFRETHTVREHVLEIDPESWEEYDYELR